MRLRPTTGAAPAGAAPGRAASRRRAASASSCSIQNFSSAHSQSPCSRCTPAPPRLSQPRTLLQARRARRAGGGDLEGEAELALGGQERLALAARACRVPQLPHLRRARAPSARAPPPGGRARCAARAARAGGAR